MFSQRKIFLYLLLGAFLIFVTPSARAQWPVVTNIATVGTFTGANGFAPCDNLILGTDGNLYGSMSAGNGSLGTVFKISTSGSLTTLCTFNGSNGANPQGGLVQASDGNYYGTTGSGGIYNEGTVFKITQNGVLTTLYSFNGATGAIPRGALFQSEDGNLYGTTSIGGGGSGTVSRLAPAAPWQPCSALTDPTAQAPMQVLFKARTAVFTARLKVEGPMETGQSTR